MKVLEFVTPTTSSDGYYDVNKDKMSNRRVDDTRKPKLTLAKINRLKKMRAQDRLLAHKRQDLLSVMYGDDGDQGGGGGFGF